MQLVRQSAPGWKDYELLDTGEFEKLERFGGVIFVRPEPQAIWGKGDGVRPRIGNLAGKDEKFPILGLTPSGNGNVWNKAHAVYARSGQEGSWDIKKQMPEKWTMQWEDLTFMIRPTSFKHTGLFPEQASNWKYLREHLKSGDHVLNLFAYTGGASIAALSVGAEVTHVDGSKPVVTWAKENAKLSGLQDRKAHWVLEDVMTFVQREVKRGHTYDAIIMDPPAFGRGPDGQLWKFEEHLPKLLALCGKLLNKKSGMLLVNAYSLGHPALAIEQLVKTHVPFAKIDEVVELTLKESSPRCFELPTGIVVWARW